MIKPIMVRSAVWSRVALFAGFAALLICLAQHAPGGTAPEIKPSPAALEFFEKNVRPVLARNCYSCHASAQQLGGLRLDSRGGTSAGWQSRTGYHSGTC